MGARTHGTLSKWNDDRGFGFISPAQGGGEIFVHVSSFPRDGTRPRLNELISFETQAGPDGKLRAVRVMRPGVAASRRPASRAGRRQGRVSITGVLTAAAILAIGAYAYKEMGRSAPSSELVSFAPGQPASRLQPDSRFKCDGRTTCAQMTSCAEANYFLRHCPNTKMDGNGDGEPCEQQWCN